MQNTQITHIRMLMLANVRTMVLYLFTALFAMTAGLYFQFVAGGTAGGNIAIAMYVVAGLLFLIGELTFFVGLKQIKDIRDEVETM